mmetsp:Transcript_36612/g.79926  ORF Transcript_36612/g.79926 Transcript_36612/m.79926 type:complete len:213 (+) Transcript_36612:351-989(+)
MRPQVPMGSSKSALEALGQILLGGRRRPHRRVPRPHPVPRWRCHCSLRRWMSARSKFAAVLWRRNGPWPIQTQWWCAVPTCSESARAVAPAHRHRRPSPFHRPSALVVVASWSLAHPAMAPWLHCYSRWIAGKASSVVRGLKTIASETLHVRGGLSPRSAARQLIYTSRLQPVSGCCPGLLRAMVKQCARPRWRGRQGLRHKRSVSVSGLGW